MRSETAASPERAAAALAGLRAYQQANRVAGPARDIIAARSGRALLIDFGGAGRPVVFVPSLINAHDILDLSAEHSMLRWLATQGVRPLLVDWGAPKPQDRDQDIGAHVEALLLPMLRDLGEVPALVGYCLGGTMAAAAAATIPVAGLAMIAAPWRFGGFPSDARRDMAQLWQAARPMCEQIGMVPMEVLQTGFWRLDPARTIAKYERFATLDPDGAAARNFVAIEDWANGGAPLTFAAGRQLFEGFAARNLPGRGQWRVGGARVTRRRFPAKLIEFISTTDRIVPAATAFGGRNRHVTGRGHVGMVVGGDARRVLWEPLAHWLTSLDGPK